VSQVSPPAGHPQTVKVWSLVARSLHWLLAAAVITAWVSGHRPDGRWFDAIHHTAGYVAGAVVLARLIWGWCGQRHERFAQFVRGPRATLAYARQVRQGTEPRHIGHNPLGACMVLALLACTAALALTGFLYTTEWLWGYAWLASLHAALGWLIAALLAGHLSGVALASWRHRDNLVAAMLTGRKRAPTQADIN
jgi:cytochrome b